MSDNNRLKNIYLDVLAKELGHAMLEGGTFLSAAPARMLACDCRLPLQWAHRTLTRN
jgi:hypothetical protein